MEYIEKIIDMADAEFGAMAKNGKFKTREEIDTVYKLMDIVKDGMCIIDMEENMYDDDMSYARDGRMYRGGSYRYDDGSYARGRGRNVKRDNLGRYSREGGYRRMDGYSRADGTEEYIEHLRDMMHDAPDEKTRQGIKRMIDEMEMA